MFPNEMIIEFDNFPKAEDGIDGKDGKDGKDGYTPRKNVDYFDGIDGKDGYTPIKGIDYVDGKDGRNGVDGKNGLSGFGMRGAKGEPGGSISNPPEGCHKVTNIYIDADLKLVVVYE